MKEKAKKIGKTKKNNFNVLAITIAIIIVILVIIFGIIIFNKFNSEKNNEEINENELPYSDVLVKRLEGAEQIEKSGVRPDYLPSQMFVNLPEMPEDFYPMREIIRLGRITDFENLEEKYWQQPEFFPQFESIGLPLLQNPPKDRWGAYGIAVYPADWVKIVSQGEETEFYFFIKSGYLVETYQGINLLPVYPEKAEITTGVELPDGIKSVTQNPEEVKNYFDVFVEPNPFILEPNFPIYKINGTRRIKVSVNISEDIPPGDYVVAIDTGAIPEDFEYNWTRKYLNLYTSGGMTKLDRPYYQMFIRVNEKIEGDI